MTPAGEWMARRDRAEGSNLSTRARQVGYLPREEAMNVEETMTNAWLEKMCGGQELASRKNFAGQTRLDYLRQRFNGDRVVFRWGDAEGVEEEDMYFSHVVGEEPELDRFCDVHDDHSDDTRMWDSKEGPAVCTDVLLSTILEVSVGPPMGSIRFKSDR